MIKKIFYTIIGILLVSNSFAGGATCYKYKVKLEYNNQTLTGFICYIDAIYNKNECDFLTFIKQQQQNLDTITFYKALFDLDYPQIEGLNKDRYKLIATTNDKIINLKVSSISKMELLQTLPCNFCFPDKNNCEYWVGHNVIITELNEGEIKLLNQKPLFTKISNVAINEYSTIYFVCYSTKTTEDFLEKYITDFDSKFKVSMINDELFYTPEEYQFFQAEYIKLKEDLRKINIVVFRLYFDV